jgi:hypothetical protein
MHDDKSINAQSTPCSPCYQPIDQNKETNPTTINVGIHVIKKNKQASLCAMALPPVASSSQFGLVLSPLDDMFLNVKEKRIGIELRTNLL